MDKQAGPIICLAGPPGVGKTSLGPFHRDSRSSARSSAHRLAACVTRPRFAAIAALTSARLPGRIHPGHEASRQASIRCFCSTRSTRWRATFAAIRPRPCWRCSTRSRTTSFSDHYIEIPYDLSNVTLYHDGQQRVPDSRSASRSHGGHSAARVTRSSRSSTSRGDHLLPKQRAAHALKGGSNSHLGRRPFGDHPPLHA